MISWVVPENADRSEENVWSYLYTYKTLLFIIANQNERVLNDIIIIIYKSILSEISSSFNTILLLII